MNRSAEEIRATFREQVPSRRGLLAYCFDSFAASLEIFLHYNVGQLYLTFFRSFVVAAVFLVCAFLFSFDVEMRTFGEAVGGKDSYQRYNEDHEQRQLVAGNPGVWSTLIKTRLSPIIPRATGDNSERASGVFKLFRFRIFPVVIHHHGLELIWTATLVILVVSRVQMAWNFGRDRLRIASLHRYPGEPLPLWNPMYVLFDRMNFRMNLVRVVCEPCFCVAAGLVLSIFLSHHPDYADRYLFLARWLFWGGILLGVKAYLDDRQRVEELMVAEDEVPSLDARIGAMERRSLGGTVHDNNEPARNVM